MKLVGHPRREILALGVGDLAAFDDRHHLVTLDRIAEPLAQLGDGAEQPHRHPPDTIAGRHEGAGNQTAPAQDARLGRPDLDGGRRDLLIAQLDRARLVVVTVLGGRPGADLARRRP